MKADPETRVGFFCGSIQKNIDKLTEICYNYILINGYYESKIVLE